MSGTAPDRPVEQVAGGPLERKVVLHPRTAAARHLDRARSTGSHVRGHTVAADDIMAIVGIERRSAMWAAVSVVVPIFLLPVLFLVLEARSVTVPPLVPWLVLGPVTLGALVLVAVVHDRRVTSRERRRSITYADRLR